MKKKSVSYLKGGALLGQSKKFHSGHGNLRKLARGHASLLNERKR